MSQTYQTLCSRYENALSWLLGYDDQTLEVPQGEAGGQLPDAQDAMEALAALKAHLIARGEATPLFGRVRDTGIEGILGNLQQSVFGEPAYPSVESKAAHLLYFVVKNHPFTDGNKRSGAFLFVEFLQRNNRLLDRGGEPVINNAALTALTLLVAESDPKQKDVVIRLIMNMLSQT